MREEVKKMEEISNKARFLAKTGIQTSTELKDYIETKSKELNTLKGQRE